ncbi:Type IV fimbrial biogenesis protein PilX [Dokdonella koreensis DS-123]|uniref:Type IV fimbrial biogenesis protein PilX n=2 Tax=Dokdonella TaxID=323413 RepID=A0A167GGZ8_9GAMM|nr:Type IV fimbrial biogenesis protein PilX [Dokdonella koreensis DS-123]
MIAREIAMKPSRLPRPVSVPARGAVLFVALIFLILLTLLALTASSTSVLQERMTGGMRNRQLALMGSESALRNGEFSLWSSPTGAESALPPCGFGLNTTGEICQWTRINGEPRAEVLAFRSSRTWDDAPNGSYEYGPALHGLSGDAETASLASQPQYLVEGLGLDMSGYEGMTGRMGGARLQEAGGTGPNPKRALYRVTSRSQGGSSAAAVRATESVYSMYTTNNQSNPSGP